jgi:hypothetical protein
MGSFRGIPPLGGIGKAEEARKTAEDEAAERKKGQEEEAELPRKKTFY